MEKNLLNRTIAYIAFTDLAKAFNRVNKQKLWSILIEIGVNMKFLELLKICIKKKTATISFIGI